ncbi:RNA polymerase III subunit Rpc25 [Acephala macrosclerotiorum]|nr:RNA polymerase III subunit Rpc25 [Acephala macrosclerotiorum]
MFILTKIADLVQIIPEDFGKDPGQAIEDNINAKYANKVIQKIGLCICLYDLLSASEGLIGHGTGLININVEFRLVVFRPFKHEVMTGRISSATTSGLRIRTPFYDEIFVPAAKLPEGSSFNHEEQLYTWQTDGQTLWYDNQETVRFRIEDEIWHDQSPIGPNQKEEQVKSSPYQLIATMEDAGLGPCLWWDGEEAGEEEMGEGEEDG